ncbi:MAG: PrpF family protein [Nitrospinaceae bacterium]|jgi:2-methylaconitate isomerase|nr:PrpF family protein [Nitrospinaceae bacterium]MBT3819929.1 PrpF family protein [Nitrospinaceae bacterium]MBT4430761.1 PrpF family protein [Nitrospinaceae bacterium]MBT5367075.1 PrpF family protein [Nitrospinaceae bacterium]MBT5948244.1 PrpF family protein [Nitrospinaceae bacterium]
MTQRKIPAAFYRGGTSRAIFFHAKDMTEDPKIRDAIFLRAIGSPDPNSRQLDGLGGGTPSLSKVAFIAPSSRPDADVDFTFGQVSINSPQVDYAGNCGNMSSAVGHFAVDEGLVPSPADGEATVRIHNTNTGKIIISKFQVEGGCAAVEGDYELPGVAGTGSPIRLEFTDPGGASTGKLLPSGAPVDIFDIEGIGEIAVSMVDATTPCIFVRARDLGISGTEAPGAIDTNRGVMVNLEQIRAEAAVRMGISPDRRSASEFSPLVPKVGIVAPPGEYLDQAGSLVPADTYDILSRMMTMGTIHRAYPLTGSMCLAVAARIPGSIPYEAARTKEGDLLLGHASGTQPIGAYVSETADGPHAEKIIVYRTARRLMEGAVLVPESVFER